MTNAQWKRLESAKAEMFTYFQDADSRQPTLQQILDLGDRCFSILGKQPQYVRSELRGYFEALKRMHEYKNTVQAYFVPEHHQLYIIGTKDYNNFVESIGHAEMVKRNYSIHTIYPKSFKRYSS